MPFPGHQAGWAVAMVIVCMDTQYLKFFFNFTLLNRIQLKITSPKFRFLNVSCLTNSLVPKWENCFNSRISKGKKIYMFIEWQGSYDDIYYCICECIFNFADGRRINYFDCPSILIISHLYRHLYIEYIQGAFR